MVVRLWFSALVLTAFGAGLPAKAGAQSNLLVNPGFESGSSGWQSSEFPTFLQQNWHPHGGQYAASVTAYYDCCNPYFYANSVWQNVAATPGLLYTAQLWTYLEDASSAGDVRLDFLNAQSSTLPGSVYLYLNDPPYAWASHTLAATAPAATAFCRIMLTAEWQTTNQVARAWIDDASLTAGVVGVEPGVPPARLELAQSFPNPAGAELRIGFALPAAAWVRLRVYDPAGRVVATLAEGPAPPGEHAVRWDRRTADGRVAPAGLYLYELTAGAERRAGRMLLLE